MDLLLTGGGDEANNADLVIAGFRHLVESLTGRMARHLYVSGCTVPAKIGDDVKARAVKFARKITKEP